MTSEKTRITDAAASDWLLYDGDCRLCVSLAKRWETPLARRRFQLAPLQADWVRARLAVDDAELLREMRVLTAEGRVFGGAEAVVELARKFWWARWLTAVARWPRGLAALRAIYRWVAARRHCSTDACAVKAPERNRARWFDPLPLLLLPALAAGSQLAKAVCLFLTAFWSVRFVAASFIFDVRPYLTSGLLRLGYHATNLVFVYLLAGC